MEVKIRKARGGWHENHAVYEWSPEGSETWYLVKRKDLCVYTGQVGKGHYDLLREFFNRLLQGEMITAEHCRYFRKLPLLVVNLDGGGKAGQGEAETHPSLPDHQHAQHRSEACRPAPLVSNLNGGDNMGKKKQKEKTGYDPKAIREAAETLTGKQEKPKTEKPTEKPAAKQPEKPTTEKPKAPSDNDVVEALKQLGKAGSREISDKLGVKDPERGRAYVRNAMKRLAEAGKVKVVKSGKQYSYEAA